MRIKSYEDMCNCARDALPCEVSYKKSLPPFTDKEKPKKIKIFSPLEE